MRELPVEEATETLGAPEPDSTVQEEIKLGGLGA